MNEDEKEGKSDGRINFYMYYLILISCLHERLAY